MSPNKCILSRIRPRWSYHTSSTPAQTQDATPDYPQSRRTKQVVRLRNSSLGRQRPAADPRSADPPAGQWPAGLFRLRETPARLRPAGPPPLRVRAAVADRRGLRLRIAARRLPTLRGRRRAGSLGHWQVAADHQLSMVSGRLGSAAVLEGSGHRIPHHLGTRPRFGPARCPLGPGAPRFDGRPSHRRRRDPVATRPSLPDARLSDRRRLPTPAVDRPRTDRGQPAGRTWTCWATRSAPGCGSCAATCGSPISRCWPNRPAARSTCSIASTS